MMDTKTGPVPACGPFVALVGATATGKTALSIEIARALNCEIVSADSVQVYKGLDIGSAKPTVAERQGVPHHMLDCADPRESFTAARYQDGARRCIAGILGRGRLPLVVGGTGLYVHALTYDVDFSRVVGDEGRRQRLRALAEEHGPDVLYARLEEIAPERARAVHPHNVQRVIRALEIAEAGGAAADGYDFRKPLPGVDILMLGLKMDRAALYRRIDARVDAMIKAGLVQEVQGLLDSGVDSGLPSMQGLGYKEIANAILGRCTLEQAIADIKRGTRRYAKRQETWFKRDPRIEWFEVSPDGSLNGTLSSIIDCVSEWKACTMNRRG